MSSIRRTILTGRLAVVVFALGATLAHASCGDYLLHETAVASSDALGDLASAFTKNRHGQDSQPRHEFPCRNGSCRRAPDNPPIPSVPPTLTFSPTSDGLTSVGIGLTIDRRCTRQSVDDVVVLDDFLVWEIEHPPRCA